MSTPQPEPTPDPLAIVDAIEAVADGLDAAIAVLVRHGWTDEQARMIVLVSMHQHAPR